MGERLFNELKDFAPDLLSAAIILAIGILITKIIINIMTKALRRTLFSSPL